MRKPVVVIGGGIVGTAIAYELQCAGAEVVLVERGTSPQGASAFSFASISALDEPQRDVYLLKSQGMVGWRGWGHRFGDSLGLRFAGDVRWAESREGAGHLMTLVERAISRGYPVRYASKDEVTRREPLCEVSRFQIGTVALDDGQLEPLRAIDVLRSAFIDGGGSVLAGRANLLLVDQEVSVRVADTTIEASTVVVAAGTETTNLLERLGWEIPLDASPGLLAVTDAIDGFLNGTVYVYPHERVSVHLRQLSDGRVLVGERSQDEVARHPTMKHARTLVSEAQRHFPPLETADVDHYSVEWRPMPRDHMPIVGRLPGLPSVYVATGHSGITLAPILARLITDEITQESESERLKPFRPGRFSLHQADADLSIEEAFASSDVFLG